MLLALELKSVQLVKREGLNKYNPSLYGYEWATDKLPSFQMEPQGYRGYIEGHPVREI